MDLTKAKQLLSSIEKHGTADPRHQHAIEPLVLGYEALDPSKRDAVHEAIFTLLSEGTSGDQADAISFWSSVGRPKRFDAPLVELFVHKPEPRLSFVVGQSIGPGLGSNATTALKGYFSSATAESQIELLPAVLANAEAADDVWANFEALMQGAKDVPTLAQLLSATKAAGMPERFFEQCGTLDKDLLKGLLDSKVGKSRKILETGLSEVGIDLG